MLVAIFSLPLSLYMTQRPDTETMTTCIANAAGPHPLFSRGTYGILICLEEKLTYHMSLFTTCTSPLVSYAGFPTKTAQGIISPRLISLSKYDPLLDPETIILEGVGFQVDLHLAAHSY